MDIYLVGGAVRDALLSSEAGVAAHVDRDWVVVGATPQAMVAHGFVPVGRDFPVFLHPTTKEEYALARTERKTSPGYHGFSFHANPKVTLVEDLARRDLTINAMAVPQAAADDLPRVSVIDPYGGQRDLHDRVLRHVTSAFAEDPVRILRLARFAARFADFTVAPQTQALMAQMVQAGEVDHLVPERVWQELARGLMEQKPSRMFQVLRDCGALARLLPELDGLWGVPQRADHHPEVDTGVHVMMVLDMSAQLGASLPVRFACLCHDLGKGNTPPDMLPRHIGHEERSVRLLKKVCGRWRVPGECRELAEVVAREHGHIHGSSRFSAAAVLRLLERCDAIRRPERFAQALLACECDARGRLGFEASSYPQRARLLAALAAVRTVDTQSIAMQVNTQFGAEAATDTASAPRANLGPRIAQAIRDARTHALQTTLNLAQSNAARPTVPSSPIP